MVEPRIERERLLTFISDPDGFRAFFFSVIAPMLHTWKQDLHENTTLTKGELRGRQFAIIGVREGIERAFENATVTLPDWLAQELHDE